MIGLLFLPTDASHVETSVLDLSQVTARATTFRTRAVTDHPGFDPPPELIDPVARGHITMAALGGEIDATAAEESAFARALSRKLQPISKFATARGRIRPL